MQLLIYLAKKAVLRCWGICVHPLHNMYARVAPCIPATRFTVPDSVRSEFRTSGYPGGGVIPCGAA